MLDIGISVPMTEDDLTPVEPSIDNLMVGDVVERDTLSGIEGRLDVLFIGNDDYIALTDGGDIIHYSKGYLKSSGYKIISPSPKTVLKRSEIAAKFDIEEDNMEITN